MRHLHLVVDEGGRALVDGQPLVIDEGSDPAAALVNHAQQQAAQDGALLAHLRDAQGMDTWLRFDRDGTAEPVAAPTHLEPPSPTEARPSALTRWDTSPRRQSAAPASAPSRRALLVGGSAAAALLVGGGVWAATRHDGTEPASNTTPAPRRTADLPSGQYAPAGWSDQPRWSLSDVDDPRPLVPTRGTTGLVVTRPPGTGALRLVSFDVRTGTPRWNHDLAVGTTVTDGPYLLQHDGRLLALVATERHIQTWDAETGKDPHTYSLPRENARVGVSPLGPWAEGGGRRFYGLIGQAMRPVDIPKNASCFGTVGNAMLALNTQGEAWKLEPGKPQPKKPTKLAGIKGFDPGAVAVITDDLLVMAWNKGPRTKLRAYHLDSLKPSWTTDEGTRWAASLGTAQTSPDQTWATVDNRLLDLRTGRIRTIAAKWRPAAISNTHAWGDDGTYTLTCDRSGRLLNTKPSHYDQTQTVHVVAGIDDLAVAVSGIGNTNTLYGLGRA